MRILFLNPDVYVISVINSIERNGHEVDFLVPTHFHSSTTIDLSERSGQAYYVADNEEYKDQLRSLVSSGRYDFVFPSHSDGQAAIVAEVFEENNIRGLSKTAAKIIQDKESYQRIFESLGIPCPRILGVVEPDQSVNTINSMKEHLRFPCIAKPVDGTGGNGIKIFNNLTQLRLFFSNTERLDRIIGTRYIIQEYIAGRIYTPIGHVADGKVVIDMEGDIETTGYPYAPETTWHTPSRYPSRMAKTVTDYLQRFCDHVGLDNLPWGVDVIVDDEQNLYVIDFCWRLGRNSIRVMNYTGESDYGIKLLDKMIGGKDFVLDSKKAVLYKSFDLTLGKINSAACSRRDLAEEMTLPTGQILETRNDSSVQHNGYALVTGSDLDECFDKFKKIKDSIEIEYL